jgi:hypothetical protein
MDKELAWRAVTDDIPGRPLQIPLSERFCLSQGFLALSL